MSKSLAQLLDDGNKDRQLYTLWIEGFAATGEYGQATGYTSPGSTFDEAVENWIKTLRPADQRLIRRDASGKAVSYWGCRIYDNEADARRTFG